MDYARGNLVRSVAMMATEWVNEDRRLMDQGGGLSRRDGLRWIHDFGYEWEDMPNFAAHAVADAKHSDLFCAVAG